MIARVLGLDLSTAASGVGGPEPGKVRLIAPRSKERAQRLSEIVTRLDPYLRLGVDVAVLEEPFGGRGSMAVTRILAEVHGAVKVRLYEHGIVFAEVGATTLKRFATGRGNATKDDMIAAALSCGVDVGDSDDMADAFWLQCMGRWWADGEEPVYQRLQLRQVRQQAVSVVKWPQLTLRPASGQ